MKEDNPFFILNKADDFHTYMRRFRVPHFGGWIKEHASVEDYLFTKIRGIKEFDRQFSTYFVSKYDANIIIRKQGAEFIQRCSIICEKEGAAKMLHWILKLKHLKNDAPKVELPLRPEVVYPPSKLERFDAFLRWQIEVGAKASEKLETITKIRDLLYRKGAR